MGPSIRFKLALAVALLVILSTGFALVATTEATRMAVEEKAKVDLDGAASDISKLFDMFLLSIEDQIQAVAADPIVKSKLMETTPRNQPPGLAPNADERSLAAANQYFRSNQSALFRRYPIFAISDVEKRLIYISTRPDRHGSLAFPNLLLKASVDGLGIVIPARHEWLEVVSVSDLIDRNLDGISLVSTPIYAADRKLGYVTVGPDISNWIESLEKRLGVLVSLKIGSEIFYGRANFASGTAEQISVERELIRPSNRLSLGWVRVARDINQDTEAVLGRIRRSFTWILPMNWLIGLAVYFFLARQLRQK